MSAKPNASPLSRREAVGFVPLALPERNGRKERRFSLALSLGKVKGEWIEISDGVYAIRKNNLLGTSSLSIELK